jgi:Anti-sigma factor NepR
MNVMNLDFAGGGDETTRSTLSPRELITRESIRGKSAGLGRDVQSKIGQELRAMYDDVLSQGVPDRFVEFLNRLDHKRDDPCPDATSTAATATQKAL